MAAPEDVHTLHDAQEDPPSQHHSKPAGLCLAYRSSECEDSEVCVDLDTNHEFDIGRREFRDYLGIEDRCVSTHHLRIRCIGYEDEEHQVAPMVYTTVLSSSPVLLTRHGIDEPHTAIEIDKTQGYVLLSPGDHLRVTNQLSLVLHPLKDFQSNPPRLDSVRRQEAMRFSDRFRLTTRVLGVGAYAAVYVALNTSNEKQLACKIVSLPSQRSDSRGRHRHDSEDIRVRQESTAREYNLLKTLSHPNIISLEKVIRTSHNVYIFQELITGGDLLSYLDAKACLSEPQAAAISRQLLEAVDYLHRKQVVHRDIKPENILMTSWRDGGRVVLTDFGQSRTIEDVQQAAKHAGIGRMYSIVGTYGYTAPEVYHRVKQEIQEGCGYSKAIDIWSIGCVTAMLLTNHHVFPDGRDLASGMSTMSQFASHLEVLDAGGKVWDKVGRRAKSFLRGCLATKEEERLTASEGLQHPWFAHPHYKAEVDAAYQRAIQDWQPREQSPDLIEFLDTSDIPADKTTSGGQVRSHHFAAAQPNSPTGELHASPAVIPDTPTGRNLSTRGLSLHSSPPRSHSGSFGTLFSQVDREASHRPQHPYPPWRTSTIPHR